MDDATAELERLGLGRGGPFHLKLTTPRGLERSRALHRMRVLRIPGAERESGRRPAPTRCWRSAGSWTWPTTAGGGTPRSSRRARTGRPSPPPRRPSWTSA
ncbi:hypothetical protein LUX33_09100 [Actinomadura madurae]|uniref:hypothetical protein n=1 Tax=Actinomadura madurae TaxID=1993 RepID=UPI0020D2317C|nr:hypothetical protein [Actinomadura madurae]MCP9948556.1 hypothetical protein [Actinomadura madurae]